MDYDEFAQTRQPDDLFDDDFVPVTETPPPPIPTQQPSARPVQHQQLRDNANRSRGRGYANRPHDRPRPNQNNALTQVTQQEQLQTPQPTFPSQFNQENQSTSPDDSKPPPPAASIPTGPSNPSKPIPSVRGSRLNTGGVQKPKLSEDELSARLAAAKLNNAKREERHRLAEADEASFQQREAADREKRREEGIARKAMEGERERNRQRKLAGRGGREWDERKEDGPRELDGGGRGRGRGHMRGAGGVRADGELFGFRKDPEADDFVGRGDFDRGGYRGRGRGGAEFDRGDYDRRPRGGGRHKGRGRPGPMHTTHPAKNGPASFQVEEFPALGEQQPPPAQTTIATLDDWSIVKPSKGDISSWADQVEAGAPPPPTPPPPPAELATEIGKEAES